MSRSGYDRYISIFSPEGKLYQVEYAHKAVKNCGITAIAIRGKTCALVVSQKKVPDKLILESSVTSLFRIASDIGMCVTGRPADCLPVVTLARREAAEYTHRTGEACPVSYLAQKMADKAQFGTQNAGVRLLGVSLHFFSLELMDDGTHAPRIYRVDPSGYCISYYASATGAKDSEALHFLEKRQKEQSFQQFDTLDRVATLGLSCLQTILNEEIKARDVEVGFVRLQEHQPHAAVQYEVASAEMIEAWLTQIAERD